MSGETILHIMATQSDPIALRKYLTHFGEVKMELIEAKDVLGEYVNPCGECDELFIHLNEPQNGEA